VPVTQVTSDEGEDPLLQQAAIKAAVEDS